MKKHVLFFTLVFSIFALQAQKRDKTFKSFKLDLAAGAGFPFDSKLHSSGLFAFEPKYSFNDHITTGLRFEFVNLGPSSSVIGYIGDANFTSSGILTTDYYFNTKKIRPFVGIGIGIFDVPAEDDQYTSTLDYKTKAGFMSRAGIEAGRFRSAIELNVSGKTEMANFSYLSVKAGFYLWGARIKK